MRLFQAINKYKDISTISADSFRFHVTMKSMFFKLLTLINPVPESWLDKMTGNSAVLRDIYREYQTNEKEEWRHELLKRVIPFVLCLMDDENFEEVIEWYLYRIIQERSKITFTQSIYPHCWYHDYRPDGRIACREIPTVEETRFIIELNKEKYLGKKKSV